MHFPVNSPNDLQEPVGAALTHVGREIGFIPNLLAVMSEAPALMRAYLDLQRSFSSSSLTTVEQQIVLLAASVANQCTYCVPIHTATARQAGAPDEVIDAIRSRSALTDVKLEALRTLTSELVTGRGSVAEKTQSQFAKAGFGPQQALEVVLGVVVKTLSNYTNHLAEAPLDEALAPLAWTS